MTLADDAGTDGDVRDERLVSEAELFGRYLLGERPVQDAVTLYVRAAATLFGQAAHDDDPVLRFVLRHPWSLTMLESALALRDPEAPLRRRLLVMFAIIEVQPRYSDRFMAFDHRLIDVLRVAIRLGLNGMAALAGLVLLPIAARQ